MGYMSNATTIANNTTGREVNHREILAILDCFSIACAKQIITTDAGLWLDLGRDRKIIVNLNDLDLFDVEVGRFNRRAMAWQIDEQVFAIDAETLARTVHRMI